MVKQELPCFHETVIQAYSRSMLEGINRFRSLNQFPPNWCISSQEEIPFVEWYAQLTENLAPSDTLKHQCENFKRLGKNADLIKEMIWTTGQQVGDAILKKNFTRKDFETFLHWLKFDQKERADHEEFVNYLIDQYQSILKKTGDLEKSIREELASIYEESKINEMFLENLSL